MKTKRFTFTTCVLVVLACAQSFGQGLLPGYLPDDPTEVLHELLGTNFAFTATVRMTVTEETNSASIEMTYTVRDRNLRTDFVVSRMPDLEVPQRI